MAFDQDKIATAFGFLTESSRRVVRSELERTVDDIDLCKLGEIGTAIVKARRVFVYGTGRSGLVLKMVAMRLMHLGLPVQVVGETTTTAIREGDLLLLASGSGSTRSVLSMAEIARANGAQVAAVTAKEGSPVTHVSDTVLIIPAGTKVSGDDTASQQYAGSLFEQSLLVGFDILFHALWKASESAVETLTSRHTNLE